MPRTCPPLRLLFTAGALALAPAASQAMFYLYTASPQGAYLPINHVAMPTIIVDVGCCNYLGTTLTVSYDTSSGVGGLAAYQSQTATLTTSLDGQVLAWSVIGREDTRFRHLHYATQSDPVTGFSESLQLMITSVPAGWVPEGPVYGTLPGSWVLSAVPEPASGLLLAAGVLALAGWRCRGGRRSA